MAAQSTKPSQPCLAEPFVNGSVVGSGVVPYLHLDSIQEKSSKGPKRIMCYENWYTKSCGAEVATPASALPWQCKPSSEAKLLAVTATIPVQH
jgi:hypothetical protein